MFLYSKIKIYLVLYLFGTNTKRDFLCSCENNYLSYYIGEFAQADAEIKANLQSSNLVSQTIN